MGTLWGLECCDLAVAENDVEGGDRVGKVLLLGRPDDGCCHDRVTQHPASATCAIGRPRCSAIC